MGLSMLLSAKRYCKVDEAVHSALTKTLRNNLKNTPAPIPDSFFGIEVKMPVVWWRSFYQVHIWFEDHVPGGVDGLGECDVDRKDLEELLTCCQRVLVDHSLADMLLPTEEGHSNPAEYDDVYFEEIEITMQELQRVLQLDERWKFTYSSW